MSTLPAPCGRPRDELAELALGTLTGRDRAEALAHVERCGRCAAEVEELSRVADVLLQVAPESEPPAGFEVRLLERLAGTPHRAEPASRRAPAAPAATDRRGRSGGQVVPVRAAGRRRERARRTSRRDRILLAAAVACIVVAGAAVGWVELHPAPAVAQHPTALQARLLGAGGAQVGRVVASPGSPAWLFMVVDSGTLSGRVTCRVGLAGGRWETIGTFALSKGYGTWSAPLAVPASSVRRAELVSSSGAVLAAAAFPPPASST